MTAIQSDLSQEPRAQRENSFPKILSFFGERKPRDVEALQSAASPNAEPTDTAVGMTQNPIRVPSAEFEKVFAGLSTAQDPVTVYNDPSPSITPIELQQSATGHAQKSLAEEFDEIEALTNLPRTSRPLTFVPGPLPVSGRRHDGRPTQRPLPHMALPKPDLSHASPSPSDEVAAALETLERVHADIARDKAGAETVILRQQHDIQNLLAEAEKRDAQIDAMQADIDEMRLALSSERNRLQELEKQSRAHEVIKTRMTSVVQRAREAAEQAQLERDRLSQLYEQERTNTASILTSITSLIQKSQTA